MEPARAGDERPAGGSVRNSGSGCTLKTDDAIAMLTRPGAVLLTISGIRETGETAIAVTTKGSEQKGVSVDTP